MKITLVSTRPLVIEQLQPEKFYAFFSSTEFFTFHNHELERVSPQDQSIPISKERLYVAEGNDMKTIKSFYISNRWKSAKY